jgi:flagellar basal-body rod modification protein FlgD
MVNALSGASSAAAAATESTKTTKASTGLAKNFDDFLKLLTVQLKNQDPTSPMETNEFTNQIVQFSQVEQQINTNKNLEALISLNKNVGVSNALSYVDKVVKAESDSFNLKSKQSYISYDLPEAATDVTISITTENGRVLKSMKGDLTKGEHKISWDGKDAQGNDVADGQYKLNITAKNKDGADIVTKKYSTDIVTQVDLDGENTTVYMKDIKLTMDQIKSIKGMAAEI